MNILQDCKARPQTRQSGVFLKIGRPNILLNGRNFIVDFINRKPKRSLLTSISQLMSSSPYLLAEQDGQNMKHVGRCQTPPHFVENDSTCCAEQSTPHFLSLTQEFGFWQPTIYTYMHLHMLQRQHFLLSGFGWWLQLLSSRAGLLLRNLIQVTILGIHSK